MSMSRRAAPRYRRRLGGRRKSSVRIGWWPALLFAALCALAALAGMTLEEELRRLAPSAKPVHSVMQIPTSSIATL